MFRQILEDCLLVEFTENFLQRGSLIDIKELSKWNYYFNNNPHRDIYNIPNRKETIFFEETYCEQLNDYLRDRYSPILSILELGDGKISLCGPDFLFFNENHQLGVFDFYFCSCTITLAINILQRSLEILQEYGGTLISMFYEINNNVLRVKIVGSVREVNFHCIVYSNKHEMLRNVGPSISKHGYNFTDGYFGTISSGILAAMGAFLLDTNYQDINFHKIINLGLDILIPGIEDNSLLSSYESDWINFSTLQFDLGSSGSFVQLSNGMILSSKCGAICVMDNEEDQEDIVKDILPEFRDYNHEKRKNVKGWIKNYESFTVGISDDRYVAFNNIRKKFNLNDDIFKLLCNWWLIQEMMDAKIRLYNVGV